MTERKVSIKNKTGLHARPAAAFVNFVKKYPNDIRVIFENSIINPKSIINILAAGLNEGAEVLVQVDGDNGEKICAEIVEFIENIKD